MPMTVWEIIPETKDALGNSTVMEYDANGNLLSQTDRTGAKTTYTYDANNRMVSSVDALGQTTHYSYDEVGNLISTTTPEKPDLYGV